MKIHYSNPGKLLTILLALPFAFFGITIYAPTLPTILDYFQASTAATLFTIVCYLFGFSLGLIFLNFHFIRRRFLGICLIVYPIITLFITYTHHIELFFLYRFLLGFLAAIILLAIEDNKTHLLQQSSNLYINVYAAYVMVLTPIISPLIGGVLNLLFDWHAIIFLLAAYALLLWLLTTVYFRSHPLHRLEKQNAFLVRSQLLTSPQFQLPTFKYSLLFMNVITLATTGSFLFQTQYAFSPQKFGIMLSVLSLFVFIGHIIAYHMPSSRLLKLEKPALTLALLNSLFLLLFYYLGSNRYEVLLLTASLNFFIVGLLLPLYAKNSMSFKPGLSQLSNRTFTGTWVFYVATFLSLLCLLNPYRLLTLIGIWLTINFFLFALAFYDSRSL